MKPEQPIGCGEGFNPLTDLLKLRIHSRRFGPNLQSFVCFLLSQVTLRR
jgi:hypothetical protein